MMTPINKSVWAVVLVVSCATQAAAAPSSSRKHEPPITRAPGFDAGTVDELRTYHPSFKTFGRPSIQEMSRRTSVVLTGPGFPRARHGADHLVNFRHVFATILDLAGASFGEFAESLAGRPPVAEVRAYGVRDYYRREQWPAWHVPGNSSFIRTTRWRLTRRDDRSTTLHDITVDPFTRNDVAAAHPDTVSELQADLDRWILAGEGLVVGP